MSVKAAHRLLSIVIAVPILLWAATGIVFLTKPGYEAAYERLSPRTYALPESVNLSPQPHWREFRLLKTTLGNHLVVKASDSWQHLDPVTLQARAQPTPKELESLVADAIAGNPARYGKVTGAAGGVVTTDTGVEITLDWATMTLSQRGRDTRLINTLYHIHYLQWLGRDGADRLLGALGILLLVALLLTGSALHFVRRTGSEEAGRAEERELY